MSKPKTREKNTLLSFITDMGPGFLVTVGFIDPGNISANIIAGARFGYSLLWLVPVGTIMVILFQEMSARLGIASKLCLSEAIRIKYSRAVSIFLGLLVFLGTVATVIAEILGAAVGINILTGLPVIVAGLLVGAAAALIIWMREYHHVEDIIIGLVSLIGLSYLIEIFMSRPAWGSIAYFTLIPHLTPSSALLGVAILGAIIMPSNLYLHSAIVQEKKWKAGKMRHEFIDTTVSMVVGGLINAAIIIVAAAVFFKRGIAVNTITDASLSLKPLLGTFAKDVFAIALIFAGFSSSITGLMAGAYGVCGFAGWREEMHSTEFRGSFLVILFLSLFFLLLGANPLYTIILTQVVLGLLLPFSLIPLLLLMRRRDLVGQFTNGPFFHYAGWTASLLAIAINAMLVYSVLKGSV